MADALKVPGYTVERLLGRGGSAEVWRARVARSGALVALKHVRVHDDAQLASVRNEAAVLATLDHPNLLRVHEFVPVPGGAVLVLDHAAGGSLAGLIRARGRLTPGEVITALAPIAAALAYTHDQSVVHGDVSAANVLFTESGLPLLSDLGVARLVGDRGPVFGTPCYIDPAVAVGAPPGPQSDVFMLGGVALHALTGMPTWPDASTESALDQARAGVLRDVAVRLADAGVPEQMRTVLCRALEIDPRRRGTAADFALTLRHSGRPVAVELAAGRGDNQSDGPKHAALPPTRHVGPRARPVLPPRPDPAMRRRRLTLAAAVAAAVAGAAGVLAWAPWQQSNRAAALTPAVLPTATPTATHTPAPAVADSWLTALDALDARRAQAYARRDATVFDGVYADSHLRGEDAATLSRLVPPGCGLVGVRTSYSAVHVSQATSTRAVVTATARLAAARLVCGGHIRSAAEASRPTTLRIELVATSAGIRIARLTSTT